MQAIVAIEPTTGLLPLDRQPAAVYVARLPSKESRRRTLSDLRAIAKILGFSYPAEVPWHQLRYQHVAAIQTALLERFSPTCTRHRMSVLRCVLEQAWLLGLMPSDDYQRARRTGRVGGSRLPAGRALDRGELLALFQTCQATTTAGGARAAAILGLLYGAGLRRSEVAGLDLSNYDGKTIRIVGKGNVEREVPLPAGSVAALENWLLRRGRTEGPLFVHVGSDNRIWLYRRLSARAIARLVERVRILAGVLPFTTHDLRRTFVGDLLDAGVDISVTQQMAGHRFVTTTQRYDRRPEEVKRKAAKTLHVPFETQ